jgi:hypothetical protein
MYLYNGAAWRPVQNYSGGMMMPSRGFIPHVQVGNGSLFGLFNTPSFQASSHLWLSKTGILEQYVSFDMKAWAEMAGNPYWISCECEGYPGESYTDVQIRRLGEIYAWGHEHFGWPYVITDDPDGRGLGTHRMGGASFGGHSCPGNIRANQRAAILDVTKSITPPPTATPPVLPNANRFVGRPTISLGTNDPDATKLHPVAVFQTYFNEVQCGIERVVVDGSFGPATDHAARSLQAWRTPVFGAIGVDGIVGVETWIKLNSIVTWRNV